MITRDNIVKAIFDNQDRWSCPEGSCFCKMAGSVSECVICASHQLAEYELAQRTKVLDDAARRILAYLSTYKRLAVVDGMIMDIAAMFNEMKRREE